MEARDIRMLIGPYAGQVKPVRLDAANAMLADGRAILPDAPYSDPDDADDADDDADKKPAARKGRAPKNA